MNKVERLLEVKEQSYKGGGDIEVEIQHNLDKLTARERINKLLDAGTFIEIGSLVERGASGVITGYGTIDGRLVYVYSQDFTSQGGGMSSVHSAKICSIIDMALKMGAPIVQILDSAGACVEEGIELLKAYGAILKKNTQASGVIPQISIVAGPCVGASALSYFMSDITIIAKNSGEIYVKSPDSISEESNRHINIEEYGNADSLCENGSVQIISKDDIEALDTARKVLSYLPSNNIELAPRESETNINFLEDALNSICEKEAYDVYGILQTVSDKGSFIEMTKGYGREIITGFARINGLAVGVFASNRKEDEGRLSVMSANKISRFIKLCNSFNIPIISIIDSSGVKTSVDEEKNGLAFSISRLIYTLSDATVPKLALIVGDAKGTAYLALASKECCFDITLAWPSARIAISEPAELIKNLYKEDILKAEIPKDKEIELINLHKTELENPYTAAEKGVIDDIIVPAETRARIYAVLDMLSSKRELRYPRKR